MATVRTNPILNGLSGMLGKTIVFKNLRGKTIMANRPSPPQKQSEQQKANRSKFRDASCWARMILLDPQKKDYYLKKAKKLKLPNAYTAAITDYMRSPRLSDGDYTGNGNAITFHVSKKNFDLKKAEVVLTSAGEVRETRTLAEDRYHEWTFTLSTEELRTGAVVYVSDEAGNVFRLLPRLSE